MRRCLGQQLHLTATLNRDVPPGCGVNAVTNRQETMILQNNGFVITQCLGDSGAFFEIDGDATKVGIDRMVIVKSTDILCDRIEFATQRRPRSTMDRVGMGSSHRIGARSDRRL